MRLIDADALIDKTDDRYSLHEIGRRERDDIVDALEYAPTIQPDPHIGRWVPVGVAEVVGGESAMWGSAIAYHKCSECNGEALEEGGKEKLSDFCPNCGAKMEVNHETIHLLHG